MPAKCKVCAHPKRDEIDRLIVGNEASNRSIAKRFGLKPGGVDRHRLSGHVNDRLLQAQEVASIASADSLLAEVTKLKERAGRLLDQAEKAKDLRTASMLIGQLRGVFELFAKISGELPTAPVTNVLITSNEWIGLRTKLLGALAPFPDARLAVARALADQPNGAPTPAGALAEKTEVRPC